MGPKRVIAETSSGSVRVTVTVETPVAPEPEPTEWDLIPELPVLEAALRDRLANRLSAKCSRATPVQRITAAWQAGADSRGRDLAKEDLVRPGLANGHAELGLCLSATGRLVSGNFGGFCDRRSRLELWRGSLRP